jgi:hypothetical protein
MEGQPPGPQGARPGRGHPGGKRRAVLSDRTRVNVVSLPPEAGSLLERPVKPPGADALPLPAAVRKVAAAVPRLYLYPSSRPLARAPWLEAAMGTSSVDVYVSRARLTSDV